MTLRSTISRSKAPFNKENSDCSEKCLHQGHFPVGIESKLECFLHIQAKRQVKDSKDK